MQCGIKVINELKSCTFFYQKNGKGGPYSVFFIYKGKGYKMSGGYMDVYKGGGVRLRRGRERNVQGSLETIQPVNKRFLLTWLNSMNNQIQVFFEDNSPS